MSHDGMQWEQLLWAAGHRVTPQRSLVLDAVCSANGHTTLGEVYAFVRQRNTRIDRSTVYRALHLFTDLGIVLSADHGNGETSYEIRKPEPHHHLLCRQCHRAQEITGAALQGMFDEISRTHGFHVHMDHLVLFGLCADCQQASTRDQVIDSPGAVSMLNRLQ